MHTKPSALTLFDTQPDQTDYTHARTPGGNQNQNFTPNSQSNFSNDLFYNPPEALYRANSS